MKRQQVASFNVTLDPWQSRSSPRKEDTQQWGASLGSSTPSSSALRLDSDGSSGVERSKERSSRSRDKSKKKKKNLSSPHKDKGEGSGPHTHLSKEAPSWSKMSSPPPRSWAPRAESGARPLKNLHFGGSPESHPHPIMCPQPRSLSARPV